MCHSFRTLQMSIQIQISEIEKIAIVNYFSDKLAEDEAKIINNWLGKNKNNKLFFDQMSDVWQAGYFKTAVKDFDADKAWKEIQQQVQLSGKVKKPVLWIEIIKIAAVFVVALFLGGLGYYFINTQNNKIKESNYVEYFSPLGSRSFVQLADGSKVWLNAGSTLKYKNSFGTVNRELVLTGEAFFEVKKNETLPFIVKTSDMDIIALGTKFNVKAYSEEKTIETTLIEGSVKLESTNAKMQNVILKPNEKAVYTKKSQSVDLIQPKKQQNLNQEITIVKPKLEIIESVETEPIISWKDKRWVITNEKLGELAVKLERRYDVNLIFDNDLLKEYAFGGTLEDETLEQILEVISLTSPIKYVIDGNTVYIMADGHKMEKFKNLMMK